jgi:hypothetical protein
MADPIDTGPFNSPPPPSQANLTPSPQTDKEKIGAGAWIPCRVCWDVFMRLRLTARFCDNCERAFCEGEHGNFTGGSRGVCVRCFSRSGMQLEKTKRIPN